MDLMRTPGAANLVDQSMILRVLKDNGFDPINVVRGSPCSVVRATNLDDQIATLCNEVLQRSGVTDTAQCLAQIRDIAGGSHANMHAAYAAVVAGIIAQRNMQPNAAVTLLGPDPAPGATYASLTSIPLTPRDAGNVLPAFEFNERTTLVASYTSPEDTARGWLILANSMKFQGDVVSNARGDVGFNVFSSDACASGLNPLQPYQGRTPSTVLQFTASAYHSRATPQELVHGLTLVMCDTSCLDVMRKFTGSLLDAEFGGMVAQVLREMSSISYSGPSGSPRLLPG